MNLLFSSGNKYGTVTRSGENPTDSSILIYSVDKVHYLTEQAVRRCKEQLTLPSKNLLTEQCKKLLTIQGVRKSFHIHHNIGDMHD